MTAVATLLALLLAGVGAVLMLVAGSWHAVGKLRERLSKLERNADLTLTIRDAELRNEEFIVCQGNRREEQTIRAFLDLVRDILGLTS